MPNKLDELRTEVNRAKGRLSARYSFMEITMKVTRDSLSEELAKVKEAKKELEEKQDKYHKYLTDKEE